ncbi:MAG: hypothetical protein FJY56_12175 [Betaproteobacteria bacterium]|nr:hypothetical protein [Betaproteobacteria bacterium]
MLTETSAIHRALLICAVIIVGLALDQHVPFWGQLLVSIGVWALLLYWLYVAPREQRLTLIVCVAYATAGECFLSRAWRLYDYRLGNIPAFVPPGHALLFMLGAMITAYVRDWVTWFVPIAAAPFVVFLALIGADTFGLALYALFIACMVFSRARKLYAVMFVLALAMEIYGTALGNWTWRLDVPWLGMSTINPPLTAGVFYCVLDLLVVTTVARLMKRENRRMGGAKRNPSPALP